MTCFPHARGLAAAALLALVAVLPASAQSAHTPVGDGAAHHSAHAAAPAATDRPATPTMRNGVQTISVAVTPSGYSPARIALRAGVPARIVFTRTVDGGCVQSVKAPELGVAQTALPLGRPVAVSFTPGTAGTFSFACASGMVRGAVIVRS